MGDGTKQERLEAALNVFFKFASQQFAALVVVLDDLQWADLASLKMLEPLMMKDLLNIELMIIGCFRTETINSKHPLKQLINSSSEASTESDMFSFTQIKVENFSLPNMVDLLSKLLSKNNNEVQSLAQLCISRTRGNIFHACEYLSMLVQEGLLKSHAKTSQWDWRIPLIENETKTVSTVATVIQNRINRMQPDFIEILEVAACLGHSFHPDVLFLLWRYRRNKGKEMTLLSTSLESSEDSLSVFTSLLDHAIQ
jgi:predicted ATPase